MQTTARAVRFHGLVECCPKSSLSQSLVTKFSLSFKISHASKLKVYTKLLLFITSDEISVGLRHRNQEESGNELRKTSCSVKNSCICQAGMLVRQRQARVSLSPAFERAFEIVLQLISGLWAFQVGHPYQLRRKVACGLVHGKDFLPSCCNFAFPCRSFCLLLLEALLLV